MDALQFGKQWPMKNPAPLLAPYRAQALAVLRIVTGYMFVMHGTGKLFHFPVVEGYEGVNLLSLGGAAGVVELVCGALVLVGLFTRIASFLASGQMAVAYFMAHATLPTVLVPLQNAGELAVLYCFVFLFFVFAGPGAWALDRERAA